jgi:predicted CoA-binding protein
VFVVYKAPKKRIESTCAQYALRSARTGRCGPGWPGVVWVQPNCKELGKKERKAMKERGHQVAQNRCRVAWVLAETGSGRYGSIFQGK